MEKSNKQLKKLLIAGIIGALTIILAIFLSITLEFNLVENLVMSWILTTFFALFAFFTVEPIIRPVQYVEKPVIQEVIRIVEKPIIKEIQIPMENRIIEVIEKPVIQETIKYVDRPVYIKSKARIITRKSKKLNIPRFNFIASTQTRTYHKRTCKFARMLKKKFKLHSNSKAFFKRKHFKACKTCLKQKAK